MAESLAWFLTTIWPWIIGIVHAVVTVVASSHVVLTKATLASAIGWVGIIWLTPLVGSILYFMFGVNRIQRKARTLMRRHGSVDSSAGRRALSEDALHQALGDDALHLAALGRFVSKLTHLPLVDGNRLTPLTSGRDTDEQMIAAIDAAKSTVGLMVYIFDNDAAGKLFANVLAGRWPAACKSAC